MGLIAHHNPHISHFPQVERVAADAALRNSDESGRFA
jgi:hypothetical protein